MIIEYQNDTIMAMPRKIKALIADLKKAGFSLHFGKGSHRVFKYGKHRVVLSGKDGADAKRYQEKDVKEGIEEIQS